MYPSPAAEGFTVYTKTDCKFCAMVKELLEEQPTTYVQCDEFLDDREAFFAFTEAKGAVNHKTFPIIFYDGIFVGGFADTVKVVKKLESRHS